MSGTRSEGTNEAAAEELRRLVRRFVPSWAGDDISDATPLGSAGLDLDSIAIVELLVACERRFGVAFPDALLDVRPLTVGALVRHLERREARPEGA